MRLVYTTNVQGPFTLETKRFLYFPGEVHDERKEKAESLQVTYAKLLTNTEIMADLLDEDMPEFPKEEIPKEEGLLLIDDADNAEGNKFRLRISKTDRNDPRLLSLGNP